MKSLQIDLSHSDILNSKLKLILPDDILSRAKLLIFNKGEILLHQGDSPSGVYCLIKGKVQIEHLSKDGKDITFCIEEPLSMIGAIEIFQHDSTSRNLSTVKILKTSTIVYFSLNYINTIGLNEPVFLRFLCQQLANKLFISSQLKTTMCLSSLQRVSNYLMNEYNKHGSVIRLERRELVASFLSISVRHLNRVLAELQENQIIELKNKTIIVKDSELLKPE